MSTYVVSDVHGHRDDLVAGLQAAGLVGEDEAWCGEPGDTLWVLGDLFDRGPDGVGTVALLMRLEGEAKAAGGRVRVLLGNHEILTLATHRFGDVVIPTSSDGRQTFARVWLINGGNVRDQLELTDEQVDWLSGLDSVALDGDQLLMHCDSLGYLEWGSDIDQINEAVRQVLRGSDKAQWWETWARYVSRYAFVGDRGQRAVEHLLRTLGGERVIHGHSIISSLTGGPSSETTGPLLYAKGRALDIDGGHFDGGPLLFVRVST